MYSYLDIEQKEEKGPGEQAALFVIDAAIQLHGALGRAFSTHVTFTPYCCILSALTRILYYGHHQLKHVIYLKFIRS